MAVEIVYDAKELQDNGEFDKVTRHFSTEQEGVENIVPEEEKVGIHLSGESVLIPFRRVHELRIDLDPETVEKIEEEKS